MKKVIFAVLLIILVTAGIFAFSIVRSFNVESYKKQVIASLEQLTGRHVSCADEASLSWRPKPTFIMNDLVISNQDGSSTPNMVSVKQIQVEMDWGSFLRPSTVIKKITLKNPSVLVERLHSYQTNFNFPYLFNPEQILNDEGIIKGATKLFINTFEIVDGSVTYHNDLTSETFVIDQISGQGQIDSLVGPFSFKGKVDAFKKGMKVDLNVNKIAVSQPVSGTLAVKDTENNVQADMSYTLSFNKNDDWLTLEGKYSAQNPTDFFAQFENLKWPDLGELKGYFKWAFNPKKTTLKELILVQGNDQNSISCNLKITTDPKTNQESLVVEMDRLDLALWRSVLEKLLVLFPVRDEPITVEKILVKQLLWNDQSASDALIQGNFLKGALDGNLSANLPFDTSLSVKGQWQPAQRSLQGEINVQTQDLFSLVRWGTGDNPSWLPSVEKVPSQWSAKVDLSSVRQLADIQLGTIDKIKISGMFEKTNEIIKTDLKIQNMDFDVYYPNLKSTDNQVIQKWLLDMGEYWSKASGDTQIALDLTDTNIFQNQFDQIIFKGKSANQTWNIETFKLQKEEDIDIQFSGQIYQFGTPDFNLQKAQLRFDIPHWDNWNDRIQLPDAFSKLEQFNSISGVVNYSGNANDGEFEVDGSLDDLKLKASGRIMPSVESFDKVHLVLNYPDFSQLMKLIQLDKVWSVEWKMPVDFDGTVSKDSQRIDWEEADISLGRNRFKSSGQWHPDLLDVRVQADQLELDAFIPALDHLNQEMNIPADLANTRLDIVSDRFTYGDIKGSQFKLKASSEQQRWKILGLDCLVGDAQPGRLSLDGTVDSSGEIQPDIRLEWDKIQVGKNGLKFGPYRFAEGEISGNAQIKSKGNSWASLMGNATGQGNMNWTKGIFYGMDASSWLSAVQSVLSAGKMAESFTSSLQYALSNGKTTLPDLEGSFTVSKGFLNFTDVHGSNDLVSISGGVVDWALVNSTTHIKMPIILTAISRLPAIVFDFNYNTYSIQNIPFEKAFDEELRLKNQQSDQARQLQNLKAIEIKNQQMRSEAQNIMNNMEKTLKQLQERVALHADEEANKKLDDINYTAQEIRDLAVRENLDQTEYTALLEKARLWAVQVTDLDNFYARQDLLNKKVETKQLSPMVDAYLTNMEQIYQQHPQSVILAEIVMNSRQVANLIKEDEAKLASAQDAQTAQSLVIQIQNNFDKIEKAHQYAQKLHLSLINGGVNL